VSERARPSHGLLAWLYQGARPIPTTHNGTMWLTRRLGTWRLFGLDGSDQATPYMDALWRLTLRRVAEGGLVVRRALVLGVALGATPALVRARWPEVDVVAVDWEPTLFELGRSLGIHRDHARTRFVAGDAAEVTAGLEGTFDLVLVDLFRGRRVAEATRSAALIDHVAARLAPGGVVAVNAFSEPGVLEPWRARFERTTVTRCAVNLVAHLSGPR